MKIKSHMTVLSGNSGSLGVIAGVLVSFIISALLISGVTSLMMRGKCFEEIVEILIFAIRMLAVLAGVLVGTSIVRDKCIVNAGAISFAYLLALAGVGIVLYDGSLKGFGLCAISVVLGGVAGCLFRLKLQNKTSGKKKNRI